MCTALWWVANHLDRVLAFAAVIISTVAMVDVRHLFKALEKRDKNTEDRARHAVVTELLTHTASLAAYSRAAQFIEFYEDQPDRATAIAMLMSFRLEQLLSPDATKEGLAYLLKTARDKIEKTAGEYGADIVASGIGKWNALYYKAAAKAHKE
jgi:hypothetical protein